MKMGPAVYEFTIRRATPSGNKYKGMHWAAKARLKKFYKEYISFEAVRIPKCPAGQFRKVTIERHGSRALDPDNLAWGAKPLLDAIVLNKLLEDDSPRCCHVEYRQVKTTRRQERVRVIIEI